MNCAASVGLAVKAMSSDAARAMQTAIGRIDMKSPMIPGQKKSGTNAATVVRVDTATALPTSEAPVIAASTAPLPSCTWR